MYTNDRELNLDSILEEIDSKTEREILTDLVVHEDFIEIEDYEIDEEK